MNRFREQVRKLVSIALVRLPQMVDPATGLMVFRVDGEDLIPAGTSLRYTAMTLLGVEHAMECGLSCDIDVKALCESLGATLAGAQSSGDLGLVLWAAAGRDPRLALRALCELAEFSDVARVRGGAFVHTTELAWVVAGLSEALAAGIGDPRDVRARLDRAFVRLLEQRGASGLTCFARPVEAGRRPQSPRELLQGELGFFDAQVYTILACLKRDAVTPDPQAREVARVIGERLLHHQHPLGQWGWHYNARTGALVDLYPVYSVHQHGMAPMALLPLERALGVLTTAAVARGVMWLFGDNELGERLVSPERAVIWRSLRRRSPLRRVVHPLKAASLLGAGRTLDLGARLAGKSMLEIDHELRPYELGFCLLAFSEIAASHRPRGERPSSSESRPTLRSGASPDAVRTERSG